MTDITGEGGLGPEPQPGSSPEQGADDAPSRGLRHLIEASELDTRLLGMVLALIVLWVGFNILSEGQFLTARNLWNLSVQSASIAIMATGMVLIIVSRNIDLSVGAMLGFLGYFMAMVQTKWIPDTFDLGFDQPYTWIIALVAGVVVGAIAGGLQGFIVAYAGVPAFIVTLGGFLAWRGLIFRFEQGQTLAPLDKTFQLLGGGSRGSLGEWRSWALAIVACVLILLALYFARRRRLRFDLPTRPIWLDIVIGAIGCGVVLAGVGLVANNYPSPVTGEPTGIANPVAILIIVTLVMAYVATRRRFGRYVYAYGGNPEAAELGGINTRRTVMATFSVMGILVALSAAIQTARLNAAVTNLGIQNELDVIAAAVIGGTSFSGGIGTIPGAVLGAVVMQSLRSGMVLLAIDSPSQDIVVGVVLVAAVAIDAALRKRNRAAFIGALITGVVVAAIVVQTGRP